MVNFGNCLWCDEPVEGADPKEGMLYFNGVLYIKRFLHINCYLRGRYGSVGHQEGKCGCRGGPNTMDDPPGMSKREAADAAVFMWQTKNGMIERV